ncbi:MAG: glycosyl hydrolase [Thermoanaerobaculia bacterium]|nr:glycosyl hydrolase [Thermoanaerobaculia bacterium]
MFRSLVPRRFSLPVALGLLLGTAALPAAATDPADEADPIATAAAGLTLRSIGPALMGGRIADLAVDPRDPSTWYLAVGSGGVWKTGNAGITWTPVFDDQPSYSVGCVTVDPTSPDTVWVGTGENVSGRHVGWGDGVYKSLDGGGSWQRMGLARSEHIGKIVVHPEDGNVVWVAAEGPLWSSGGDRGVYKTSDGGRTWRRVLQIDDDTGVTDLVMDPRNPDLLYAAAYQRRRQVWAHLAGGPSSGIYKSTDGGESWRRVERGLPSGDVGKIGLAVSPADPDVVYATIEAGEETRGFYRSRDRGESWEKRSSYVSGGTGPHYYQEIVASPHDVDRVYQMDVFLHATSDGGATFEVVGTGREKHSDNHALWIDPDDPEHLLAGTDAGLYETFDGGATWRHFENLPVSQFYRLAVSDAAPFYEVLGGAQDLGTLIGPVRTRNVEGVANSDWLVPLGGDGYHCAFDRENPDIVYLEWQVGRLERWDRASDDLIDIQPQPEPGEEPERWNWDAPLHTSPHVPGRLWFGSQRLWRSDDRGDSWTPVSADLTRGGNRYELPIMGRYRGVDALWDHRAMSWYATLTTISESPLVPGLLYVGTDDGLIQVSEDGGATWRRATPPPQAPERSFVQEVMASLADPDTVYAALDNHKMGDFRPLLYVSGDRGRSWRKIVDGLPESTIVWALAQDHEEPALLFAGTEFGIYFSLDGGGRWRELSGGAPTIAFRDLAIHRGEGDLVGASFGRGFYVLDDYGPLRELATEGLAADATLFGTRDAWWWVPSEPMQARGKPTLGSTDFTAPNPPFGALVTYHLAESATTAAEKRKRRDQELSEAGEKVPFPGWDTLAEEALQEEPRVLVTVRDAEGNPVRTLAGPAEAGLHRVSWDLRRPAPDPVDLEPPGFRPPWAGDPVGPLAHPGVYTVELALESSGELTPLAAPRELRVVPVPGFARGEPDFAAVTAFQEETAELLRRVNLAGELLGEAEERVRHLRAALLETPRATAAHRGRLERVAAGLAEVRAHLLGDPIRGRWDEPQTPSVRRRAGQVAGGHWQSRQMPTAVQRRSLEVARAEHEALAETLADLVEVELAALEADLDRAGAPPTPGRGLPQP